jgi:hypothetical protein
MRDKKGEKDAFLLSGVESKRKLSESFQFKRALVEMWANIKPTTIISLGNVSSASMEVFALLFHFVRHGPVKLRKAIKIA